MDEFIENLLNNETIFEIALPSLPKRRILELNEDLPQRISVLEVDLDLDNLIDDENKKTNIIKDDSEMELNIDELNNYEESQSDDEKEIKLNDDNIEINSEITILEDNDGKWKKFDEDKEFIERSDKFKNFNKTEAVKYKGNLQNLSDDEDIRFSKKTKRSDLEINKNSNNKKRKNEDIKEVDNNKKLDPNSDEYWLQMRSKLGI